MNKYQITKDMTTYRNGYPGRAWPAGTKLFPRPPGKATLSENDLREEYRALGFLRQHHPLILWKDQIRPLKRLKTLHIAEYAGRNVAMIGWPVTQKEVWTKDDLTMSFLSLEDETAMYETVVFPQVYDRYKNLLFDQQPLLVHGRVTNDEGALSVEISRIEA